MQKLSDNRVAIRCNCINVLERKNDLQELIKDNIKDLFFHQVSNNWRVEAKISELLLVNGLRQLFKMTRSYQVLYFCLLLKHRVF